MKLSFGSSHLSITSFPEIELPDFTIITGQNGAGKSHLLQAIMNGKIKTDCAPNQNASNQTEIRFYDWSSLVPQDSGYFASEILKNERLNLYNNFNNVRLQHGLIEPIRQVIRNAGFDEIYVIDPFRLINLEQSEIAALIPHRPDAHSIASDIIIAGNAAGVALFNIWSDNNARDILSELAEFQRKAVISLQEKDVTLTPFKNWGKTDLFQQSFARLFVAYRDMFLANQLAHLQKSRGITTADPLSDNDFIARNGAPPWDFVNNTLAEANLDFRVNAPELYDYAQYSPQLTKISTGIVIPFSNLSSGEKVLMSFAFCVYYANDRRQLASYPKVLLLDEIDAPLHPSMSRNLIRTITQTLVNQFGIKVIATTHSPSTIAIAPEDSVYLMKSGRPGLEKTSQAEALNVLTVGVPTLSISFDGRRQVFVESDADAVTYGSLYTLYKSTVSSERSLDFIATSPRVLTGGGHNTGCDVVKRLVGDLISAGNKSVFGLLDWDGRHEPSERICVLAHNRRNGLENVLFDPLLIAALICRDCQPHKQQIGIDIDVGFIEFSMYTQLQMQQIVTKLASVLFGSNAHEIITSKYLNGYELQIDKRCFTFDDHAYEKLILEKFPSIQSITRGKAGQLMQYIISKILVDKKDFAPVEIVDVFRDIIERRAHI